MSADLIKALEDTLARPSCEFIRIGRKAASELLAILKPQAREDAQPVAWRWKAPSKWKASTDPNDAEFVRNAGVAVQPLYTHPAPDALRVAVEGIDADYMTSEMHHPDYVLIPTAKFDAICAALQAEQKGGA